MDLEKLLNDMMDTALKSGNLIHADRRVAYTEGFLDCLLNLKHIGIEEEIGMVEMIEKDIANGL